MSTKERHEVHRILSRNMQPSGTQANYFTVISISQVDTDNGEGIAAELRLVALVGLEEQLDDCSPVMLQSEEVACRNFGWAIWELLS